MSALTSFPLYIVRCTLQDRFRECGLSCCNVRCMVYRVRCMHWACTYVVWLDGADIQQRSHEPICKSVVEIAGNDTQRRGATGWKTTENLQRSGGKTIRFDSFRYKNVTISLFKTNTYEISVMGWIMNYLTNQLNKDKYVCYKSCNLRNPSKSPFCTKPRVFFQES